MKLQYAIPSVLGLSTTLSACADPIVGEWNVDSFTSEGTTTEMPYEYGGVVLMESATLTVESDLTGTFVSVGYSGDYMDFNSSMDVTVTNDGDSKYTVTPSDEDTSALNCTLSGSTMECEADGTTMALSKGAKE